MIRAWCMGCRNTVEVPADKLDRCPACGRLYALRLLPEDKPREVPPRPIQQASEQPFDWIRISIGWSMVATLLVIAWWLIGMGHAAVRTGERGGPPGILIVLVLAYLAIRLRLVRVVLAIAAIWVFAGWMWG